MDFLVTAPLIFCKTLEMDMLAIEETFRSVSKGKIGLREARALDDRLDEEDPIALQMIKHVGVETDWRRGVV
jgi:hypothetical protein